jgi:hypothetical protein
LPEKVVYEKYKFKGFEPPGGLVDPNPTGVTLKDLEISDFAGEYTHDTHEYRIAKMLNECEDHLVMDSIMFHYLFV